VNNHTPPSLFLRFFRWFCHPDYREDIEGDLLERFEYKVKARGLKIARWFFAIQVLKLFRPSLMKNFIGQTQINNYAMFRNYLKIAVRVFRKEKSYSMINTFGLVLGFVCCLMIYLFISDELSYDKFHADGDRIYRVASAYMREGRWEPYASNSWRTAELIEANFGEVEELVRIMTSEDIVEYGEKRIYEEKMAVVDESFFDVFSFPVVAGNKTSALQGANKVVISQTTAQRYFGSEEAVGKVFEVDDRSYQLQVSAVMEDMPSNSHFHFDFLISAETAKQIAPAQLFTNIGWDSQRVYVKLAEGSDPQVMESRFPQFIDANLGFFTKENFKLFLQPLPDIHLTSNLGLELEDNGNMTHIYIFSVVAIFILLIACVNYMNLTTARSLRRAREVGMRKVLGARRGNLISQFLFESFTMTLLALLLAYGFAHLLLSPFNEFAGKEISRSVLFEGRVLFTLFISFLVIGLLAGAYPSFVLSAFRPINTIKSGRSAGGRSHLLRRGLVVVQFVISIGLIAATAVVFKQLKFMQNKELGINEDLVVAVRLQTMDRSQLGAYRNELLSDASVREVGYANMKMPGWISNSTPYKAQDAEADEEEGKTMKVIRVDADFLDLVEVEMVEGRGFSKDFPSDVTSSVVLNEAAAAQLGWEEPVGKWIEVNGNRYTCIGLVKDFHFESLHRKIPPTIFLMSPVYYAWSYIKIDGNNIPATLAHLEKVYGKFVTNREFSYSFVEDDIQQQYQGEAKFTQIFEMFTVLAIVIAGLGTFGLISFTAERKSKEIGIRKVLGASIGNVTFLLTKEFIILLLIASFIAWPVTYYFISDWIDGFVYRTSIGAGPFALATVLAVVIAMLTTIFRSMKAAMANPVQSLRDE
jgi:putative ABC transport system permease protein